MKLASAGILLPQGVTVPLGTIAMGIGQLECAPSRRLPTRHS